MPVSRGRTTRANDAPGLAAFAHHGMGLVVRGQHGVGDCPLCGSAGRFSADVLTGLWRCFVCGGGLPKGGGNPLLFVRRLWEVAGQDAVFTATVKADRRLAEAGTVGAWGVRRSPVDGAWLVPGYDPRDPSEVHQLYRRARVLDKGQWVWRLLPTPGVWPLGKSHGLHLPAGDFDPSCQRVEVCEGPWDGMALWEAVRGSSLAPCQVVAVPGCNVWRDEWTDFCRDREVTLWYDSDHPKERPEGSGNVVRAGYDGMRRVAGRLAGVARSIRILRWGPDGYDPARPSGYDVRDALSGASSNGGGNGRPGAPPLLMVDRIAVLSSLQERVGPPPPEWVVGAGAPSSNGHARTSSSPEALPCDSWQELVASWDNRDDGALEWRQELGDALAVLLAVCASTNTSGNQLFLDLIGSAGSAKTTLCRGLLCSRHCVHLENITKLISGWKGKRDGDDGKDYSFLARSNNKTWITCEFDVLLSSPEYAQVMGKARRIFDGETTATFGNLDRDRVYAALRTPWIRAGTQAMMDHDQSHLGDRFLRFFIQDPEDGVRRSILRSALMSERSAMREQADGRAGSVNDPLLRRAHALTGGYVDWLREVVEDRLPSIEAVTPRWADERCLDLAELTAGLRSRPPDAKKRPDPEPWQGREVPTRLARQFCRLATHLALVLNKTAVDADVMRVVRRVALDTAAGHSLRVVQWLCSPAPHNPSEDYHSSGGIGEGVLRTWTGMSPERLTNYLLFMRRAGLLALQRDRRTGADAWVLTESVRDLYRRVWSDVEGS